MNSHGKVFIGVADTNAATGEGIAGWQQIVRDGKIVVKPSGKPAPRTALGLSSDSGVLWLVVVDGRQNSSAGMTWHETAAFMLER